MNHNFNQMAADPDVDRQTHSSASRQQPALDYASLRREAIHQLERMAGGLWTDFNAHDPGITILEQLCYALTELTYRIDFPVPDLLADGGRDPYRDLYTPAQVLTSGPVTLVDLRKLVLDVVGVRNAWIEPVAELKVPLGYSQEGQEISIPSAGDAHLTEPVGLKGLYRVLIDFDDSDSDPRLPSSAAEEVACRLHAHRNLCEDFEALVPLESKDVKILARVEIGPVDDAERVFLEICHAISEYLSPAVPFASLPEMQEAGKAIDEIFDGPLLDHGFIDTGALNRLERRTSIYTSDLIAAIMSVAGVRAVRAISVAIDDKPPQAWALDLPPNTAPRFNLEESQITLIRGGLESPVVVNQFKALYGKQFATSRARVQLTAEERDLIPPAGRDRRVGNYFSIMHQFPAVYGIGSTGLPESASPERKAQAKRLKAYLLFFDQLLANEFAQLAQVKDLFSFRADSATTYSSQTIDDPTLALDEVRTTDLSPDHARALQEMTEPSLESTAPEERKNRFLNHLLARFAEEFSQYSLFFNDARTKRDGSGSRQVNLTELVTERQKFLRKLIEDKQAFLRRYPRVSSGRGAGFNYLAPPGPDNISGLEERLRLKLGIGTGGAGDAPFHLVEHILLRPMSSDSSQHVPLLSAAGTKDPYSMQISLVFSTTGPFEDARFQNLVQETIRDETPAHLTPRIHWLDGPKMNAFRSAYQDWQDKLRIFFGPPHDPTLPISSIQLRDARDRIIELLDLGKTYPLRDLPVRIERKAGDTTAAVIAIDGSQLGVTYELRSPGNQPVKSTPAKQKGNGQTITLEPPKPDADTTYKILATKDGANARWVYLHQTATVAVAAGPKPTA